MIPADGEFQAAARLADAARVMGAPSGALQLRLLQTVGEVASEKNSTLVVPLPLEVMRFFDQATGAAASTSALPAPEPADPSPDRAEAAAASAHRSENDGAGR